MHPVLFHISFIEARSYYVLWAFALLLFVLWTRRRCVRMFGMSWEEATSVVIWVYCAAILGAMAGSALEKVPLVLSGTQSLALIKKGGLSSGPGLLCGGLAGIWRLRRLQAFARRFLRGLFHSGRDDAWDWAHRLFYGRLLQGDRF
jgi:phosphatidylglycerol:prolipoprotein diacylglycerol transferase